MGNLSAFLHPVTAQEEKDVFISKRFLGEDGKPVPFRIRSITQAENDVLRRKATRVYKVDGQRVEEMNNVDYTNRLIVAATVEPDFSKKEMCDAYGQLDPLQVPGKMLYAGEFAKLSEEILKISGFDKDGREAIDDEVKN